MSLALQFGLLFLILLFDAVGIHSLYFDSKDDYEWKRHMAAKDSWKKMMEDK
jgi:hypothetical protein